MIPAAILTETASECFVLTLFQKNEDLLCFSLSLDSIMKLL